MLLLSHPATLLKRPVLAIRNFDQDGHLLAEYLATTAVDVIREAFKIAGREHDMPDEKVLSMWQFSAHSYFAWDSAVRRLIAPQSKNYRPPRQLAFTLSLDRFQPQWAKYNIHIEDFERVGFLIAELENSLYQTVITVTLTAATPGKVKVPRIRMLPNFYRNGVPYRVRL